MLYACTIHIFKVYITLTFHTPTIMETLESTSMDINLVACTNNYYAIMAYLIIIPDGAPFITRMSIRECSKGIFI